jgi:uncharacterized phage protein (TIGR01671 family)
VQEIQGNPTNEMREIKFRAWDNFNKRMLGPFGPFRWHDEYDLLYLEGTLDVPAGDNLDFVQFTGLTDRNGKEIYEGDVVKLVGRIKEPQIVGYDSDLARFCFVYETGEVMRSFTLAEKRSFEVIGNIYENPELLK